ncbi:uncharacterized protein LOC120354072 isoform X2 [Nilaparvata lugens]|uniref:uncharacterized protein LOC120354072 isoform X1 n=1 Tax=Nilaparvata lugens TaxID=108931 RepID=UPI00193D80C7|nr:uncharacterized protein LOC120354072 isoform X1 [Nilaparvata lugens]XP_039296206.1 uncharacterized protein LOC120354072 isoform X2 [Nilaparvata lugens]
MANPATELDGSTTLFTPADPVSPEAPPKPATSATSVDFERGIRERLSSTQLEESQPILNSVQSSPIANVDRREVDRQTSSNDVVAAELETKQPQGLPYLPPGTIETILEVFKTTAAGIEKKLEETGNRLDKKIEETSNSLDKKIEETSNRLDKKVEEMTANFLQLKSNVEDLHRKMDEKQIEAKNYTNEQIQTVRSEFGERILNQHRENTEANGELESKITQANAKLAQNDVRLGELEAQQTNHTAQINQLRADVTQNSAETLNPEVIKGLKTQLDQTKAECLQIKNSLANVSGGNNHNTGQILSSLPIFDDTECTIQPRAFIQHLQAIDSVTTIPWITWRMHLLLCLQKEPLIHFRSRITEFNSLKDFIDNFLATFWSPARQRNLLSHIITCRYDKQNTGLSMSAFSAHIRYLNNLMDNPIENGNLIEILIGKLPYSIQTALSSQSFESYDKFEACLSRVQSVDDKFGSRNFKTNHQKDERLGVVVNEVETPHRNYNRGSQPSRPQNNSRGFGDNHRRNYNEGSSFIPNKSVDSTTTPEQNINRSDDVTQPQPSVSTTSSSPNQQSQSNKKQFHSNNQKGNNSQRRNNNN